MAEIGIRIIDDEIDPVQLADLVANLREEILSLPVDGTELAREPAPPGARGHGTDIAAIIVKTALEAHIIKAVVNLMRDWSKRHRVREIEVTIGDAHLLLSKATEAQQQELVEHFINATN